MKNLVIDEIKKVIEVDFVLEKPKDKNLAHYATPLAFSLAKELKKSPVIIAQDIASKFQDSEIFEVSALNGYINFKLKQNFLGNLAKAAIENPQNFARGGAESEKILLEYVSANPTGPLHIGHVRGAVFGDTLARVGRYIGKDIKTEYYINDAGNQIDLLGISISLRAREELFSENVVYPEAYYRGDYILDIAKAAEQKFGKEIFYDQSRNLELADFGKDIVLNLIKQNLADAQIFIENWSSERSYYDQLDETLDRLRSCNGIYEQEGKIWLNSSSVGDEKDRVIVREDGRETYLAGDIVYHNDKFKRGYDRYINIWGADHHGYIARMKAAVHFLGYDENRLEVLLSQMVSLLKNGEQFKMSKRSGNVVLMSDVVEEIGYEALRFIFLSKKSDTHLEFDVDELKKEDSSNPIFYINYAHARVNQIFAKAGKVVDDVKNANFVNLNEDAKNLLFEALALNEVLVDAFNVRSMQKICDYLKSLAANFHKFYNENRVVGSENEDELLKLFAVVALSIKTALSLMGITAKDKM
ncbi:MULTISPECIES: arginine--tRNA ligase [unclassified Campylobacter]|uniref:arginine--tRNA ligase n=1 Tax=unclassified Campylobacter TaxID=2593542 RepID=UPI0014759DB4|nr:MULTISPECIES: arginine--tRNA ligase [unclassified Campylobacter]